MSFFLRDPLMRELVLSDYADRDRYLMRPYNHHWRQPIRVHRVLDDQWPVASSFDSALNELQSVMDNVNAAIGQYQSSLFKDLDAGGMKTNRTEDGNLQVAIDVSQFKPEEVNVRLCDDNLVVEAKTESSENDSYHKAEFKRWIRLPKDVKQESIKSTLTPDKKLLIDVPCDKPIAEERSRSIPIEVQKQAVEGAKKEEKKGGDAKDGGKK